jgi:hypothetical protein
MSSIGAAGGGAPINPYAGNVRAASDTDASKSERAGRASDVSQEAFSGELAEPDKTEASADRDADGFYGGPGHQQEPAKDNADEVTAQGSSEGGAAAEEADSTANHAGERVSCDGHRGTLIDFDV